ncbi:MAG: hypothetical protein HYZ42_17020 [Bacteroidetes bacterium]|nr:hypothetical protein [Bacteroidota bacterium]
MLIFITIEGLLNQQHDLFIKDSEQYKLTLEQLTEKYIPKNNLIVINGGPSPQEMYFSHRKGWTMDGKYIKEEELLRLQKLGASYLVIDNHAYNKKIDYLHEIFTNNDFSIYLLKEIK